MATTDIYSRKVGEFGGAFAADGAAITFNLADTKNGGVGLLVQNLSINYQQMVTRIYEITSSAVYYVGGRVSGNMSMTRVVGPSMVSAAFYAQYGDMCNAAKNQLDFSGQAGCGSAGSTGVPGTTAEQIHYVCKFVVLQNISMGVASQDMVINQSMSAIFGALTLGSDGAAGGGIPGAVV